MKSLEQSRAEQSRAEQSRAEQSIPHVINYCWFGKGKKPILLRKCMKSWNKIPKDWQIKEWNEGNFNININDYVREAYEHKKYAFVSDYARLWALYNFGGVYIDTDVEIYKPFDEVIKDVRLVLGFEHKTILATCFMASAPKNPIIKTMLDKYENRRFILDDGTMDMLPINFIVNDVMKEYGMVPNGEYQIINDEVLIAPYNYFNSVSMKSWLAEYTEETYTVHHYADSWRDKSRLTRFINQSKILLKVAIGFKNYSFLQSKFSKK